MTVEGMGRITFRRHKLEIIWILTCCTFAATSHAFCSDLFHSTSRGSRSWFEKVLVPLYSGRSDITGKRDEKEVPRIPQLPPPGGCSAPYMAKYNPKLHPKGDEVATFVNRKFSLQYTCNICETRNTCLVSRKAYREGLVIAVCKGCMSKHLIADNLGWSRYIGGFKDGETNIEEFFALRGEEAQIHRVNQNVWELDQMIRNDEAATWE